MNLAAASTKRPMFEISAAKRIGLVDEVDARAGRLRFMMFPCSKSDRHPGMQRLNGKTVIAPPNRRQQVLYTTCWQQVLHTTRWLQMLTANSRLKPDLRLAARRAIRQTRV